MWSLVRNLAVAIIIMTMSLPAQVSLTGFSSGFGWSSKSTAYISVGVVVNSNYHIVGTTGRPLFRNAFGTDIQDGQPFEWWVEQGTEKHYHVSGLAISRIVRDNFAVGLGMNVLDPQHTLKYRSPTSDEAFSKVVSGNRIYEMTFQANYMFFDKYMDKSLGDNIPLMFGVIYGTSGHLSLNVSVAVM